MNVYGNALAISSKFTSDMCCLFNTNHMPYNNTYVKIAWTRWQKLMSTKVKIIPATMIIELALHIQKAWCMFCQENHQIFNLTHCERWQVINAYFDWSMISNTHIVIHVSKLFAFCVCVRLTYMQGLGCSWKTDVNSLIVKKIKA